MREGAKLERAHSQWGVRRGFDLAIIVCNLPQCGEYFRCVLKIPFDETIDLVDVGPGRFRRRVFHPDERELVYVWVPYLVVSASLLVYSRLLWRPELTEMRIC